MEKINSYYNKYRDIYLNLEQIQIILNDPTTVMEFRISEDERGILQIKLKLANIYPEIISDEIKLLIQDTEITDDLVTSIMNDFIDNSFKEEIIDSNIINNHFPGYIETRNQKQKAKFVLGNLKDYEKFDFLARSVFQNHNLKILSKEKEDAKNLKLTK